MKNNKPMFSAIMLALALIACSFGTANPETALPSAPPPSETPIPATATITPSPTITPTITPSFLLIPSPTLTLFYNATATATPSWSDCPGIVVKAEDTAKGDILHILRCEDNFEYALGPLAKGNYAVGPNNKFIVYVAVDGKIYAARIGDTQMQFVFDLAVERMFTIINKKLKPDFNISFVGESPHYRLVLIERRYDEKRVYDLPIGVME